MMSILENIEKTFGEKVEGIEYRVRVGIYGIALNNEGEVAVIKTSIGYFLPGGGLEDGETHKECLEREFMEETGYAVDVDKYIGKSSLYHLSSTYGYLQGIGCFYLTRIKYKKENVRIDDDHHLQWVELSKCIKSLFLQHQAWAVSKLLEED